MKKVVLIDKYISEFPKETQVLLKQIRAIITKAAPIADEKISYAMPTFYLHKSLVHFAGYKNHIGFYPAPSGIKNFKNELQKYKTSKGAIQFPLNQPLPEKLITKIVKFRVAENLTNMESKKPTTPFSSLSAPAQRALKNTGITTLKQLSKFTEPEVLALHGIGKTAIPKLTEAMQKTGLKFKVN